MMNLEKILQKYYKYLLISIFAVAVILRWWYLPNRNINFIYDQARDAFTVQQILEGHLKILGPPTSGAPGLFHGILYYYVVAPAYFLGHGDPLAVAYWIAFVNALGVFAVFYLTRLLTNKNTPAIISALIFAFSFDAIQFSDFISNVSLGIIFVPVIYIGLLLWVKKLSKYAPLVTGLAFGLAVQSEIAFYFYIVPILLWLLVNRKKIVRREVFVFILSFVIAISTMIISEVKFSFPGLKGLYYLFSGQDTAIQGKQFSDFLVTFINQIGERLASTIYPFNISFGSLLGFGMIVYSLVKKTVDKSKDLLNWKAFLITYIPASIIASPFGGSITPYIMIGVIPAITVFLAIFLWESFGQNKTLLFSVLLIILLINLLKFVKQNEGTHPDYFTNDYLLSTELKVIDYTYQKSGLKPFSISTLTAPLFINTLWSYLYNWYGFEKYGYLPYWVGNDQVGQLGNNLLSAPEGLKEHFFIEEPISGIPDIWITYAKGDQDSISNLVEQKSFGQIIVQERITKDAK
jgi:hypothetical protein